jgi:hypothetical protein
MKKKLLSAVVVCALGLFGCGGDDEPNKPPPVPTFDTAENIRTYLEGKKLSMEGTNIPPFPNGYDEDVNYGSATQCYQKVEMIVASGNFAVTSTLGTLRDAPNLGNKGLCDHEVAAGTPQSFTSKSVLIENVKADASCFDVLFDYGTFKQQGRGNVSADGKTLTLELYFETQSSGSNCASGAVGSQTVTLNKAPFAGNAQQVYAISAQ